MKPELLQIIRSKIKRSKLQKQYTEELHVSKQRGREQIILLKNCFLIICLILPCSVMLKKGITVVYSRNPPHKTVIVPEYSVSEGFVNNAFLLLKSYWLKSDNQKQPK